nr:hypothetical protein [Campylobacter jejuni]
MVFLIPLLIIIGVIFGIDYVYFKNQDLKVQVKKEQKGISDIAFFKSFIYSSFAKIKTLERLFINTPKHYTITKA